MAIDGGTAAVQLPIPSWPLEWPQVQASVMAALGDGSWGQYHGRPLQEFADAFGEFLGLPHVWPCASGTIAVELALRGLGVGEDHEVILGGYDFPGNFRAVEAIGARPVLIDVQEGGYVLDAAHVPSAIGPQTRALIVSHLHGQLADILRLREICQTQGIGILEDACQVVGGTIRQRPAGTLGDVGVFSFGGSKLLTAGRGGAVVTRDDTVMQRVRIAAERGNDAFPMSALQAAALTPQLQSLTALTQQRLAAARHLRSALASCLLFQTLDDPWNEDWSPAFFKFALRTPANRDRQDLIRALSAEGVPAFPGFRGFLRRSPRRCRKVGSLTNCRQAVDQTILLHHPLLLGSRELLDQVILAFQKVDRGFATG